MNVQGNGVWQEQVLNIIKYVGCLSLRSNVYAAVHSVDFLCVITIFPL